jgi:hypothetical protein
MSKLPFVLACLFLLQTGCTTAHVVEDAPCEASTAPEDTTVTTGFRLTVLTPLVVLVPGEQTTLLVRIDRSPGFDAPILVRTAGLPEGVFSQPRENRLEDVDGIVVLILWMSSDSPGDFRVPNFVVQGSDGEGLLNIDRANFAIAL